MSTRLKLTVACILFACSLLAFVARAQAGPTDSIWIEAEKPVATNFSPGSSAMVNDDGSGASNGMYLKLLTGNDDPRIPKMLPFFANYSFTAASSGRYYLWVAGSPQDQAWCAPIFYRVDNEPFKSLQNVKWSGASWGSGYFGWILAGPVDLNAGTHILRIEVRTPRPSDKLWAVFLDAFVFTQNPNYIPSSNHPSISPQPSWAEITARMPVQKYRKQVESLYYRQALLQTQEDVTTETSAEVLKKIMARPLPNPKMSRGDTQIFGVHGMEQPFVVVGQDDAKVQRAYELLARTGVDSFRTAESCWHRLGTNFDNFTQLDYQFKNAEKDGQTLGLTVGYPAGPYGEDGSLSAARPEYEPMFRTYLHTLLARYPAASIDYLELGNEVDAPDVWWRGASTPAMYVLEMQTLREEADKVDPSLRTVAFAATYSRNDTLGGPAGGRRFVQKCVDLGINKYASAYSVHYVWPRKERGFIDYFRSIAGTGSAAKPIFTSEESAHTAPWDILKMFSRDFFFYGMRRVDYFLAQDFYENGGPITNGLFDLDWNPKVRLLPYALSVDAMKGRTLVGIASPGPDVEAYVLKRGKNGRGAKYSIILWRNGPLIAEDANSNDLAASRIVISDVKVTGFNNIVSAFRWNLDPIPVAAFRKPVDIGAKPIVLFADTPPSWKLMSCRQWTSQSKPKAPAATMRPPGL